MTALLHEALEVVGTLDAAEIADRVLDALVRATRARGAALWIAGGAGELELRGRRGELGRDAVAFPLLAGAETVGLIHLQPPDGALDLDARAAASGLARAAAVALANARRFEEVRARTVRDEVSGAYTAAYLADHARKELDKARRYGRCLSVALLGVEGDGAPARLGRERTGLVERAIVTAVARAARDADVLAHVPGGDFQVLLPETDRLGALMFVRRAGDELRRDRELRRRVGHVPRIALGSATFPRDGSSLDELLAACRARQDEYRASPLQLVADAEGGSFRDAVDLLLGDAALPAGTASARLRATPALVAAARREIARELARTARARGVAYVAAPSADDVAPMLAALPRLEASARAGDVAARVYLLAPAAVVPEPSAAPTHPLVAWVPVEGDRDVEQRPFLLFLSDEAAYALLRGEGDRVFHTSDLPLVDHLVARLQQQYDLRPVEAG